MFYAHVGKLYAEWSFHIHFENQREHAQTHVFGVHFTPLPSCTMALLRYFRSPCLRVARVPQTNQVYSCLY